MKFLNSTVSKKIADELPLTGQDRSYIARFYKLMPDQVDNYIYQYQGAMDLWKAWRRTALATRFETPKGRQKDCNISGNWQVIWLDKAPQNSHIKITVSASRFRDNVIVQHQSISLTGDQLELIEARIPEIYQYELMENFKTTPINSLDDIMDTPPVEYQCFRIIDKLTGIMISSQSLVIERDLRKRTVTAYIQHQTLGKIKGKVAKLDWKFYHWLEQQQPKEEKLPKYERPSEEFLESLQNQKDNFLLD